MFANDLAMTVTASKKRNTKIKFAITLISLVTIALVLTSWFSQSNIKTNAETTIGQIAKQASLPMSVMEINETNRLNVSNSLINYLAPNNRDTVSLDTSKFPAYNPPDLSQFIFSLLDRTNQDQMAGSYITPSANMIDITERSGSDTDSYKSDSSALPILMPISSDNLKFTTYTYNGYSVQQPDSTHFIFSFPDNTDQGQLTGSDALTLDTFAIQKIDFDAAFIAPKIGALGFDEMAIFVTTNTVTYKGTEFGVRMDLKDGFVYGYVQEPNGNNGDVYFQMLKLMPNDGVTHHYSLIMLGSEVSFYIDGIEYGNLNFTNNADYSSLPFSILAVVHRFTDDWDSSGDNMIVENFSLNQQ
jgi:hypothetical protein